MSDELHSGETPHTEARAGLASAAGAVPEMAPDMALPEQEQEPEPENGPELGGEG